MAYHSSDQAAPARGWISVTPSDVTDLPAGCRGLWVGGAGNVTMVGDNGTAVAFNGVAAGTHLPVGPVRVNSTGTTATAIVALY